MLLLLISPRFLTRRSVITVGSVVMTARGLGALVRAIRARLASRPAARARALATLEADTAVAVCRSLSLHHDTVCLFCSEGRDCLHVFRDGRCTLCGHWMLPACAHTYSDGLCTECGQPQPFPQIEPDAVADAVADGVADAGRAAPPAPPIADFLRFSQRKARALHLRSGLSLSSLPADAIPSAEFLDSDSAPSSPLSPLSPTAVASMTAAGDFAQRLRSELERHPRIRKVHFAERVAQRRASSASILADKSAASAPAAPVLAVVTVL
jgi:hypothetical protein